MDNNRIMGKVQLKSIIHPFGADNMARAVGLFRRADSMGLLDTPVSELSAQSLRTVAEQLSAHGLASAEAARLRRSELSSSDIDAYLAAATHALEESPVPKPELTKLNSMLDGDLLATLLHIGSASLQRYQKGERTTPDEVAARAHFLTNIVGRLEGTYNDFGVRRWFQRPRSTLKGRSPAQILSNPWTPESEAARQIQGLAESLEHLGAT